MTETWTGRAACVLLALVWFVSMGVADANAYSYVPLLAGLSVIVLLVLSAMIRGAKTVQLTKTAWLSLGVGAYFLIRCLCSPSVVESWQEASTILGCGAFYIAGVYAAQGRSLRPVMLALVVAAVLNLVYFGLMKGTDIPMECAGRPAVGPGSINTRPTTLFVYKNHAAAFLCMVGLLLFAASLWAKNGGRKRLGGCLIAILCLFVSANCHSRSPYFMIPVMLLGGWILWSVINLYENDKLGLAAIISGFVLFSLLGVALCSFFFEPDLVRFFEGIDSHDRFATWKEACRLLPQTPAWGNGALSAQWLIMALPNLNFTFFGMANFTHNEYLQAWVDYGIIGLGCMVFIITWHICRGMMMMASEKVSSRQRLLAALGILCLGGWATCSIVDFFWHHFAIAGMTAFAAGITASPYPYENARKGVRRKVSAQTARGKAVLALIGVLYAVCCAWLVSHTWQAWDAQWEFNRLSRPGEDENGDKRHALIASLIPSYPATELMDQYFRIPRHRDTWQTEVELLRATLRANPRQLNTAVNLAELLSRHGRYEEAETIYRRYYPGDGADCTKHADWPNMYALNLLRRGQSLWAKGEIPTAYSLIRYGLRITKTQPATWRVDIPYRTDKHVWQINGKYMPNWKNYLKSREQDVRIMRMLNIEPDDSWQAPDASGKPSLYRRYGAPESRDKAESAAATPQEGKKA